MFGPVEELPQAAGFSAILEVLLAAAGVSLVLALAAWIWVSRARHAAQLARVLAAFPCAALLLDWRGRIPHSNRLARRYMLAGVSDPRGLPYAQVFPPSITHHLDQALKDLGPEGDLREQASDHVVEFPGGQLVKVGGISVAGGSRQAQASLVTMEDASASVELRRALDWAALAQHMAHEIKNPLYTVLLTLQRLQMAYRELQPRVAKSLDHCVDSAIEEIEKLRQMADGFLRFASLKPPRLSVMEARELVSAVERQVRQWLPSTVVLVVECEEGLPKVRVDLEAIQRLFFNLSDNAVRAMEGKGRLFLRAGVVHWLNLAEPVRQQYVAIEVSDTGCGIPDELLGRVFDPYVTGRSGGSGLGLSICRHIIKEHGGRITLQSKVGVGTTVRVELPAYQA